MGTITDIYSQLQKFNMCIHSVFKIAEIFFIILYIKWLKYNIFIFSKY